MGNNDKRDPQSGKTGTNQASTHQAPGNQASGERKDMRPNQQSDAGKPTQGSAQAGERKDAAPQGDASGMA